MIHLIGRIVFDIIIYKLIFKFVLKKDIKLLHLLLLTFIGIFYSEIHSYFNTDEVGLFATVIILYMTITIHELGHYISAKYYGFKIYGICLGVGPKIFSIGSFEFRLVPISGSVSMKFSDCINEVTVVLLMGSLLQFMFAFMGFLYLLAFGKEPYLIEFVKANVLLGIFNLTPIVPSLDGYKILQIIKGNYTIVQEKE